VGDGNPSAVYVIYISVTANWQTAVLRPVILHRCHRDNAMKHDAGAALPVHLLQLLVAIATMPLHGPAWQLASVLGYYWAQPGPSSSLAGLPESELTTPVVKVVLGCVSQQTAQATSSGVAIRFRGYSWTSYTHRRGGGNSSSTHRRMIHTNRK